MYGKSKKKKSKGGYKDCEKQPEEIKKEKEIRAKNLLKLDLIKKS